MLRRISPLFLTLLTFFACICVHESGHALAAWFTGGRVTHIVLLAIPPHVTIIGAGTLWQESVRAAAGSGFYLILYFLLMRGMPAARGYRRDIRDAASWFALVELTGWVVSALTAAQLTGPNDADRFIAVSGANRIAVASVAAAIGIFGVMLLRSRNRARAAVNTAPARPLAMSAAGGK